MRWVRQWLVGEISGGVLGSRNTYKINPENPTHEQGCSTVNTHLRFGLAQELSGCLQLPHLCSARLSISESVEFYEWLEIYKL